MSNTIAKMDKWDYVTAVSSGVLCGTLDNLFVKEYGLEEVGAWKTELTGIFTRNIMSKKLDLQKLGLGNIDFNKIDITGLGISQKDIKQYALDRLGVDIRDNDELSMKELRSRNSIKQSIKYYKNRFESLDNYFNEKRVSNYRECIEYVAKIPDAKGLIYVLSNYFTNQEFILADEIPDDGEVNRFIQDRLFNCIFIWGIGALKAKVQTTAEAESVPEPLISLFNHIYQLPKVQEIVNSSDTAMIANAVDWFVKKKEAFFESVNNVKTDVDKLRSAMVSKNVSPEFPILLNEAIVRGFYSLRRFFAELSRNEINSLGDLRKLDLRNILPTKNPVLMRMITFSSGTFTMVDLSGAAIKSAIKNGGFKGNFVTDTLSNINFVGVIRFGMTLGKDLCYEKKLNCNIDDLPKDENIVDEDIDGGLSDESVEFLEQDSVAMMDAEEHMLSIINNCNLPEAQQFYNGVKNAALLSAGKINPAVAVYGLYKDLEKAIDEYYKALERRIQTEIRTKEAIAVIQQYRQDMCEGVEQYMSEHLEVFHNNFSAMNRALDNDDVDLFLEKNAEIQRYLGHSVQFTTMEEFDSFMESDIDFVL